MEQNPNTESQWAAPTGASQQPFGQQPFGQQQVVRAVEEVATPDYEIVGSPVQQKSASSGSLAKRLIAGIGAVSLIGGATFAVRGFAGASSNTPTEAVKDMMAAAQKSDLVGMMEQLAPGERNLMIQQGVPILEELKRLDLLSSSTNLNSIDAVKVTFAGQSFAETPLRDDIVAVKVSGGTVTTAQSGKKLYGGAFEKMVGEGLTDSQSTARPAKTGDFGSTSIATIKRNGHWYVSLSYSLAEAARKDSGKPMPTPEQSIAPVGADTPELALKQMYEAAGALDSRKVIGLLDPDEFGALQDYAPLFIGNVERAANKVRGKYSVSFPKMQIAATKDGNTAKVKVTYQSMDLTVFAPNDAHLVVDGDCVSITAFDKASKRCGADVGKLATDFWGDDTNDGSDPFGNPFSNLNIKLDQKNQQPITAVKRNGRWYIAPVRTLMDVALTGLKNAKPSDFDLSNSKENSPLSMLFGVFGPRQKINTTFNNISNTLPDGDPYAPPVTLPVGSSELGSSDQLPADQPLSDSLQFKPITNTLPPLETLVPSNDPAPAEVPPVDTAVPSNEVSFDAN